MYQRRGITAWKDANGKTQSRSTVTGGARSVVSGRHTPNLGAGFHTGEGRNSGKLETHSGAKKKKKLNGPYRTGGGF